MINRFAITVHFPHPPLIEALEEWCSMAGHWYLDTHHLKNRITQEAVMLLCVKGSGRFFLGDKAFEITKDTLFFCPPLVRHGYQCHCSTGWEIFWVHFCGKRALQLCELSNLSEQSPIKHLQSNHTLSTHFQRITELKNLHCSTRLPWEASTRLHILLTELIMESHNSSSEKALADYIDHTCNSLSEMATRAGYSKYHFCRRFKLETGTTPWRYLINQKLDFAREQLITYPNKTIKEIATELGFDNPDYFTRCFSSRYGVTPGKYRGQHINE